MQSIGLIGVGFIGKLFVDSLRDAGYPVTAYDINPNQIAYAENQGAEAADSPAAVARDSDVILLALPGTPEVEATFEGEHGMGSELEAGQIVIDSTTTKVETATEYAEYCADRDVYWVSAPLTRAAPVDGIHMMIGSTDAAYEAGEEIIETVSARHIRFDGPVEALRFKYMLQIRYAAHMAVDAEIVEFAKDSGIDARPLNDFLGMDIAENFFEDDYSQDIEGLGGLSIWDKDLGYALDVARQDDIAMPLTSMVHETYKHGNRVAEADEGHAATIARYWRALNDR